MGSSVDTGRPNGKLSHQPVGSRHQQESGDVGREGCQAVVKDNVAERIYHGKGWGACGRGRSGVC